MKTKKGQNLYEITFIGVCVLGIAMIGFFTFGGNLANIFKQSNVANLFSASRTAKTVDNRAYLSNVDLSLNGQNFKSPVESVINGELSSGANVETSGGVGNIQQTIAVVQAYIDQLTTLLQAQPQSAPGEALISSLNDYNAATSDYIAQNGTSVTGTSDPLVQAINNIQIAINLNDQGVLATNLSSNAQAYLNSLPDSQYKTLLNIYVNDLMNLGASLKYKIDSRNVSTSPQTNSATATTDTTATIDTTSTQSTNVSDYLGFLSSFTSTSYYGDCSVSSGGTCNTYGGACTVNGGGTCVTYGGTCTVTNGGTCNTYGGACTISGSGTCNTYGGTCNLSGGGTCFTYGGDCTVSNAGSCATYGGACNLSGGGTCATLSNTTQTSSSSSTSSTSTTSTLTVLQSLEIELAELNQINNDSSLSADQKTALAKTIVVYREGNYTDIVPNSYNSAVLCKSLGAAISQSICNINM